MQYSEFIRIEKLTKILDIVAYGSLAIDIAIAVVTLISLHIYSSELNKIQYFLNVAVTVEVIFTLVVLVTLGFLYHYEKILDNLARFSSVLTGRRHRKRRNR
jgi:surface polysaccharide O-acyltransferase-like enzyme